MRKLFLALSLILAATMSSFDTKKEPVKESVKTEIASDVDAAEMFKVNLPPDNNVFSKNGQTFIQFQLNTGKTLSRDIPCSQGACVCTNWYPEGNGGTGYWRQCGCYGEINNYWNEYRPCYYCVPTPNYGKDCQNG